jgi:hypothetical protein
MIRRSHLDIYVWPLALICSLGMVLPIWFHHSVIETRAGFVTRAEAQEWAKREAHSHQCVADTDETEIHDASETGLDLTDGHPITITLKCHRKDIWWKLAAVFVGPWLFFTLCVRLVGPAKEVED